MQYLQLNELKDKLKTHPRCPLEIVGVPCNQFGLQEPGESEVEILNGLKYVRPGKGYTPNFPLTQKLKVNGKDQDILFTFLKNRCPVPDGYIDDIKSIMWSPIRNDDVSWNFEKVLIDHKGQPYRRYSSPVLPQDIATDIEHLQTQCKLFDKYLIEEYPLY
ncbi:glutathione peroxidase 2 [Exaiptasia diaphana]|uniref:Glutathione peroxidase n=1 Tax=Exaiptasia diaphana TaxID=2652724 RepID=A0A913XH04_EXADI|nr:glutathione peroxidase 2 [Exaiptasia diaphana]KXJ12185.1 Glutathione peroxidase 1 [Exaiptasia diaphana]